MTETTTHPPVCPNSCPCPTILGIAASIAHQEDALACILNAECAKINKVLSTNSEFEKLLLINKSVQDTLAGITELEQVLKEKLDSIIPLLLDCM